jgi:phosphoglycerate dehydrogenase-like enzyme
LELRGATLGIVGFGSIGQAAGRLAYAMGMNIIALTRHPRDNVDEFIQTTFGFMPKATNRNTIKIVDTVTTPDALNTVFRGADYVLVATPLTRGTNKLIGMEQFMNAKEDCVVINVGRGSVIDEDALVAALQSPSSELSSYHKESTFDHKSDPSISTISKSLLKGAALDVTTIEPLPPTSPLWTLQNVLLSPHNMDMTATFMFESTEFFVQQQLPRFIRGLPILNPVDVKKGY